MKLLLTVLFAATGVLALAGCGGSDRSAGARSTVQTYWYDIDHAKVAQAYAMLTSGQKANITETQFTQSMFNQLRTYGGINTKVGKVWVTGDTAAVQVALSAPGSKSSRAAYQHLFWENGAWHISEENGGLSLHR